MPYALRVIGLALLASLLGLALGQGVAALLAVAVVLVVMVLLPAVKSKREEAFVED